MKRFWHKQPKRRRHCLTLIEATLSLSAAALVTAVVIPAATSMLNAAKEARVQMELNAIASGLAEYVRDVGYFPGLRPANAQNGSVLVLATDAPIPPAETPQWTDAQRLSLRQYLCFQGAEAEPSWSGPYLNTCINDDPWGNAYVINISAARGGAVFALSAGRNGQIDTPFDQLIANAAVGGDDYVVRLQ